MTQYLWVGGFEGSVTDPTNWLDIDNDTSPAGPPGTNDDAAFVGGFDDELVLVPAGEKFTDNLNLVYDVGASNQPAFDIGGTWTTAGFEFLNPVPVDVSSGGLLDVTGGLAAITPEAINIFGLGAGGTVELANATIGAARSDISFNFVNDPIPGSVNAGVLHFDKVAGTTTTQTITGVEAGNEFFIGHKNFTGDTVDYNDTTHTLTVMNGATTVFTMDHVTAAAGTTFDIVNASVTGSTIEAVCYFAGTMIACPDGERAVETLSIGDPVLTSDGRAMPVRWIGRNTVSTKFADPLRVLPIRIKAGALADHLPVRDLLVSPEHAVLVDDTLIQAGALVNGLSIVRESNVAETFVYYHIELAEHALVLAEGTPAESFVDNIHRMAFDNWEEHEALYGDAPIVEMDQPRARSHRQVPMDIRARLLDRATMPALQREVAA